MCVGGRRGLCGSVIQEWRGWAVLVLARPAHLSGRQLALADRSIRENSIIDTLLIELAGS